MHFHLVHIGARVRLCQRVKHDTPLRSHFVAIKRTIIPTNMNGERQIAQPFWARVVGVPRHHRRGRKSICHAGRKLIHTITARAVSHEIHTIWINTLADHQVFNEPIEQLIDWGLVPKIPLIARRAWCNVHTLSRLIELLLVVPLLIVHLRGCAAAAMHGNPQWPRAIL